MTTIASDVGIAAGATAGISIVTVATGQQVSLGKSTISSMTTGVEVNNALLPNLGKLVTCVKEQGQKFSEIAELFALEDSKIAFKETNGG